jgi:hypothetical protein
MVADQGLKLLKGRGSGEFKQLTDEVAKLEAVVNDAFEGSDSSKADKAHHADELLLRRELEFPEPNEHWDP